MTSLDERLHYLEDTFDGWQVTMEDTFQWWKRIWMEGSVCWLLILYLILFYCFAGMVCTCTGIRNGTHKKIKIIEIIVANLVVASWLPEWRPTATPLLVPQTSICFIWTFKASISPHLGRATGLEWTAPCTVLPLIVIFKTYDNSTLTKVSPE